MSLSTKIKKAIARQLGKGSVLASKSTAEIRKDICYGRKGHIKCDYILEDGEDSKCLKCGCPIEEKVLYETHLLEGLKKGKIEREKVTCPIKKWEEYFNKIELEQQQKI